MKDKKKMQTHCNPSPTDSYQFKIIISNLVIPILIYPLATVIISIESNDSTLL